ncbi:MAG: phosphoribosylaminoimidazolesuccinocarboxamide synthase [Alistipes sp.]|nr:phosphoribosylaminoimidazolesuccinocarboxamide synthase [Alistipes sp.]
MKQMELLYEGKSKQIFKTDNPDNVVVRFKDDTTAFYGIKRANILNKGRLTCDISSMVLGYLNDNGINTHFIERVDDDGQLCRVVEHFPVEVIVRNVVAGSMAKRLGMEEGIVPENTIFDLCLRRSDLGDPLINDHHAVALGLLSYEELSELYEMSAKINNLVIDLYDKAGITVVDFKIEFGRTTDGSLVLADELSPDTCRLWDKATGERMDKDRFRRDLGSVRETYEEVAKRLHNALK